MTKRKRKRGLSCLPFANLGLSTCKAWPIVPRGSLQQKGLRHILSLELEHQQWLQTHCVASCTISDQPTLPDVQRPLPLSSSMLIKMLSNKVNGPTSHTAGHCEQPIIPSQYNLSWSMVIDRLELSTHYLLYESLITSIRRMIRRMNWTLSSL